LPKQVPAAQILNAALEVIADRGYSGATTRQIAAAAGVNEVTLFRRYGSKIGLLKAAMARDAERFSQQGGVSYTGDVQADLERATVLYGELINRRSALMPVLTSECRHHPELLEVIQVVHGILFSIGGLLTRYQEEGVLRPEPALQAVATLLGPMLALGLLAGFETGMPAPPPLDPAEYVRRYLDGRRVAADSALTAAPL